MPEAEKLVRIAMWSGPRNISTAMMRAWSNRPDTVVVDEPFYAFYLKTTGKKHPGADEVIARGETDWRKVIERLTGPIPSGKRIYFQKQMTHHLLPEVDRDWLASVMNCFLIRDPREVILSYIKRNPEPGLEDLGFVQQLELFDLIREKVGTQRCGARGQPSPMSVPIVIDAKDILENPERMLRLLCGAIDVDFDEAMLCWPPGLRDTDGVWARYWYDDVAGSISFQPYKPRAGFVPDHLREIYQDCRECYEQLHKHRLH
jgi:hypothetical protein